MLIIMAMFLNITVYLTDGDLIDSQTFNLTVNPVNDPPVLTSIDDYVINEDESFTYEIEGFDVDGDSQIFGTMLLKMVKMRLLQQIII